LPRPEIVVVGGGPAGSTCAARLAQLGRRVLVLEKEVFPRFHLGESLLPCSMAVFDTLGVRDDLEKLYIQKHGARFHDDTGAERTTVRFCFANAMRPTHPYAFQVPRDDFDKVLLDHARKAGVEVRERWEVARVRFDGTRACGVTARDPDGAAHEIDAGFVVDATGRDALLARARRTTVKIPHLDKTALFSHFRGVVRGEGIEEGDIDIIVFPPGWFWVIPFKDGRTSVGAVVGSAWIRERRHLEPDAMLDAAIAESPTATRLLARAEKLWPGRAIADYSYRVTEVTGPGWIAIGDAGGFIDPLFSTGAHLGMVGGLLGAETIDAALREGDVSPARFEEWKTRVHRGTDLFQSAVVAFYTGELVKYLFAADTRTYLRRAITSMLTGDVFDDAPWQRDLRTRMPKLSGTILE
jgi:flavin-dependent dehydrogenase